MILCECIDTMKEIDTNENGVCSKKEIKGYFRRIVSKELTPEEKEAWVKEHFDNFMTAETDAPDDQISFLELQNFIFKKLALAEFP